LFLLLPELRLYRWRELERQQYLFFTSSSFKSIVAVGGYRMLRSSNSRKKVGNRIGLLACRSCRFVERKQKKKLVAVAARTPSLSVAAFFGLSSLSLLRTRSITVFNGNIPCTLGQ
jgi:hypothetical protein